MRLITLLTAGPIWAVTGTAALAVGGEWVWTDEPQLQDGQRTCGMRIDGQGRFLTIQASPEARFVLVDAPELIGLAASEEGTLRLDEVGTLQATFEAGGDYGNQYVATMDDEPFTKVLAALAFLNRDDDVVSVTVGSSGALTFPAAKAVEAALGVAKCMEQL